MVKSCCAYGCTQRATKKGVTFHAFPRDPALRKKWVIAINRDNFVPTENSRICGKHFQDSDYIIQIGKKRLENDAVPSVFDFSNHYKKPANKKRKTRARKKLAVKGQPKRQVDKHTPTTSVDYPAEKTASRNVLICPKTDFEYQGITTRKRVKTETISFLEVSSNSDLTPEISPKREKRSYHKAGPSTHSSTITASEAGNEQCTEYELPEQTNLNELLVQFLPSCSTSTAFKTEPLVLTQKKAAEVLYKREEKSSREIRSQELPLHGNIKTEPDTDLDGGIKIESCVEVEESILPEVKTEIPDTEEGNPRFVSSHTHFNAKGNILQQLPFRHVTDMEVNLQVGMKKLIDINKGY
ncbi:THAP domain-containing protein 5 isoform X2 [Tribolium castaneum]|uniref:THAP domain-containing protein 5 isoform X2 n=1 Tax=Tribolium castaneum TaxID=7070 RepID=UPI0030FE03D5